MVICGYSTSSKRLFSFFRKNAGKAFTLIEVVVTIGITSFLLMSMTLSNSSIRREFALTKNQEELRSLITYARFLSVATLAAPEEDILICGYGVAIDQQKKKAYIFRDSGTIEGGLTDCFGEIDVEPTNLTDQGSIYSVTLDNLVQFVSDDQKILFIPPDPTVVFEPKADPDGEITITIQAKDKPTASRQLKVLSSGMVSIVR